MDEITLRLTDDQAIPHETLVGQDAGPKAESVGEALDVDAASCGRQLPEAVDIFEDLGVDSTNVDEWLRANWHPDAEIATPSDKAET